MIPIMNRISAQLKEVTDEMAKEKQVVHLKRLFSDLSFEVIMSTGFGIEVNAWKDKENIVKKMARTYLGLEGGYGLAIKLMVVITMPWIAEKMKLRVFNGEAEDFLGTYKEHIIYKSILISCCIYTLILFSQHPQTKFRKKKERRSGQEE